MGLTAPLLPIVALYLPAAKNAIDKFTILPPDAAQISAKGPEFPREDGFLCLISMTFTVSMWEKECKQCIDVVHNMLYTKVSKSGKEHRLWPAQISISVWMPI